MTVVKRAARIAEMASRMNQLLVWFERPLLNDRI